MQAHRNVKLFFIIAGYSSCSFMVTQWIERSNSGPTFLTFYSDVLLRWMKRVTTIEKSP